MGTARSLLHAGKIVAGTIGEQLIIQAAVEAAMRKFFGSRQQQAAAQPQQRAPHLTVYGTNPGAEEPPWDLSIPGMMIPKEQLPALMTIKKKKSNWNRLVGAELRKMKGSRKSQKSKFTLAIKRAKTQLKKKRSKSNGKKTRR